MAANLRASRCVARTGGACGISVLRLRRRRRQQTACPQKLEWSVRAAAGDVGLGARRAVARGRDQPRGGRSALGRRRWRQQLVARVELRRLGKPAERLVRRLGQSRRCRPGRRSTRLWRRRLAGGRTAVRCSCGDVRQLSRSCGHDYRNASRGVLQRQRVQRATEGVTLVRRRRFRLSSCTPRSAEEITTTSTAAAAANSGLPSSATTSARAHPGARHSIVSGVFVGASCEGGAQTDLARQISGEGSPPLLPCAKRTAPSRTIYAYLQGTPMRKGILTLLRGATSNAPSHYVRRSGPGGVNINTRGKNFATSLRTTSTRDDPSLQKPIRLCRVRKEAAAGKERRL